MTLDELRTHLEASGWKIAPNPLRSDSNGATWYAYRRTTLPARECECNDGKPMQAVIWPHHLIVNGDVWHSAEIEVCGEAGGRWYKLRAYGMQPGEAADGLADVEAALIRAWNALIPEADR